MTILKDILEGVTVKQISGSTDKPVSALTFDSRKVSKGAVFFALKGENADGHKFIQNAINAGACAIVTEKNFNSETASCIQVENSAEAMGIMAANYYKRPSEKLQLIGVTGTNGKTTIATLLYQLFNKLGKKSGLISTVANYIAGEKSPTNHTTPDALSFNQLLQQMVNKGCEYCFAEVSSHALEQKRVAGIHFAGAVFTNITHDHLDYHKTFKNYIYAKKKLFDLLPSQAFALVNTDDKNSKVMLQNCKAKQHSYAISNPADFRVKIIESNFEGMQLELENQELWTLLSGKFNASNIAAVYGVAKLLGEETEQILPVISAFTPVQGRMETINAADRTAIVDYAHSPDALKNVLETIHAVRNAKQRIITVVGAGGNRDKEKRPVMASIVQKYSDIVILTSDNPRDENPEAIIRDMEKGLNKQGTTNVLNITDRLNAIKTAVMLSQKKDIILIAGKGHETYQEIKGIRNKFDDKETVSELLMKITYRNT